MVLCARDQTNFRHPIRVVDAANVPAAGLTYLSSITFWYKRPGDADWVEVTVVEGSSTYTEGGFREINSGVYEFCWPDEAIVENQYTLIKYVYDSTDRVDVIEARLPRMISPADTVFDPNVAASEQNAVVPTVRRGSQWTATTTWPTITGATAIYYALKSADVPDDDAILLVRLPLNASGGVDGIMRIAGGTVAAAGIEATDAQIVRTYDAGEDEHTFVLTVKGEASAKINPTTQLVASNRTGFTRVIEQNGYLSEWKIVGAEDQVISSSVLKVKPDIVRAVE